MFDQYIHEIEKYKYHIGGIGIIIMILYSIYDTFYKKKEEKIILKDSVTKPEVNIVKAEISHEEFLEFMKTLKKELQNLTMSMIEFNANKIKSSEYENFQNKTFTKDIIKKHILIDSVSLSDIDDNHNTSDYKINFGQKNYPEIYKNVIGFRLIKATIPNTIYQVTDNCLKKIVMKLN